MPEGKPEAEKDDVDLLGRLSLDRVPLNQRREPGKVGRPGIRGGVVLCAGGARPLGPEEGEVEDG